MHSRKAHGDWHKVGNTWQYTGKTRATKPLDKAQAYSCTGLPHSGAAGPCMRVGHTPNIGLGWQQPTHSSLKHGLASFLGHAAWSVSTLTERCSAACRGAAAARGSNQVETLGAPSGQGRAATDGHNHTATRAAPQPWLTHGKHVQSAGSLGSASWRVLGSGATAGTHHHGKQWRRSGPPAAAAHTQRQPPSVQTAT